MRGWKILYVTFFKECSCILGWLDDGKIREICGIEGTVRLVITLGYPKDGDKLRAKKRKAMDELVKVFG